MELIIDNSDLCVIKQGHYDQKKMFLMSWGIRFFFIIFAGFLFYSVWGVIGFVVSVPVSLLLSQMLLSGRREMIFQFDKKLKIINVVQTYYDGKKITNNFSNIASIEFRFNSYSGRRSNNCQLIFKQGNSITSYYFSEFLDSLSNNKSLLKKLADAMGVKISFFSPKSSLLSGLGQVEWVESN